MLRSRINIAGVATGGGVITQHWLASEDGAGALAVRTALNTWLTAVKSQVHTTCVFTVFEPLEVIDPATGQVSGTLPITTMTHVGASTTEQQPRAIQALVRWFTGVYVGGREIRGRTFIPGITEGGNDAGVPASALMTNLDSAANTLASDSSAKLAVWSKARGQAVDVVSAATWNQFAVLRSRRD
jgi:hypothetical protein